MWKIIIAFVLGALVGAIAIRTILPSAGDALGLGEQSPKLSHDRADSRVTTVPSLAVEKEPRTTGPRTDCPATEPTEASCIALFNKAAQEQQAALYAEPTDPAWSYPMAQRIERFIADQNELSDLQILNIDCRSTFCEIKAIGSGDGVTDRLQSAMTEFSKDSGMLLGEHSANSDGTRVTFTHRLRRP